jgi:hypothetical protein
MITIRTQNRRRTKDVIDFGLSRNGLQIYSYESSGKWGHSVLLGEYSNEERALEVMNSIQQAIIKNDVVFNMPKK